MDESTTDVIFAMKIRKTSTRDIGCEVDVVGYLKSPEAKQIKQQKQIFFA